MSSEKRKKAIIEGVVKTFGDMAFMEVIDKFDENCMKSDVSCILEIEFSEPENGWLYLFLPKELKKHIVENIYGADWTELTTEQIDDCLLELLNVLAGNYMTAYFGSKELYTLSFPSVIFAKEDVRHIEKMDTITLNAENMLFDIGIIVQGVVR